MKTITNFHYCSSALFLLTRSPLLNNSFLCFSSCKLSSIFAKIIFKSTGFDFSYTTHGYTLLSRFLEEAAGRDFPFLATLLFKHLEMYDTSLDTNSRVVLNRARYAGFGLISCLRKINIILQMNAMINFSVMIAKILDGVNLSHYHFLFP